MKAHSIALVIQKMQFKITVRYHYTTSPMDIIKRQIGTSVVCLVLFCFACTLCGLCLASWIHIIISFIKLEDFGYYLLKYFASIPLFSSLYFCNSNIIYTLWLSYKFLQLIFLVHFSLCPQIGWFLSTYLHVHWILLFSTLLLYSVHILNFKCCIFHCFSIGICQFLTRYYEFFLMSLSATVIATLNFLSAKPRSNSTWGGLHWLFSWE